MIGNYLNQTVVRNAKNGYDVYGKPLKEDDETVMVRIQTKQKRMMTDKSVEFLTDAEMWLAPDQTMVIDDVIVWESENYKVIRIDTKKNLQGNTDHKKVYLVRTKD